MPHYSRFTFKDRSSEKAGFSFYHGELTAISLGTFLTQFGTLKSTLDAITVGTLQKEMIVMDDTVLSETVPTNGFARRENKILMTYKGNVTDKLYTIEIPTPDLASAVFQSPPGADFLVIKTGANSAIDAFITAFEAIAKSPDSDSEAVTVISMRAVGRNL